MADGDPAAAVGGDVRDPVDGGGHGHPGHAEVRDPVEQRVDALVAQVLDEDVHRRIH